MNAARRSIKRRDWPRGLREPRPGYYAWDHPDGRTLAIGRVPLSIAKQEALAANLHLAETRPSLVERLQTLAGPGPHRGHQAAEHHARGHEAHHHQRGGQHHDPAQDAKALQPAAQPIGHRGPQAGHHGLSAS